MNDYERLKGALLDCMKGRGWLRISRITRPVLYNSQIVRLLHEVEEEGLIESRPVQGSKAREYRIKEDVTDEHSATVGGQPHEGSSHGRREPSSGG